MITELLCNDFKLWKLVKINCEISNICKFLLLFLLLLITQCIQVSSILKFVLFKFQNHPAEKKKKKKNPRTYIDYRWFPSKLLGSSCLLFASDWAEWDWRGKIKLQTDNTQGPLHVNLAHEIQPKKPPEQLTQIEKYTNYSSQHPADLGLEIKLSKVHKINP